MAKSQAAMAESNAEYPILEQEGELGGSVHGSQLGQVTGVLTSPGQTWVWRWQLRNFLSCCLGPEITWPVLMSS